MALSDQVPVASPFHAKSEPGEVLAGIDLTGKVAVVTGGYSGLGLETTRALAQHGATVYVPVRSAAKAEEALRGMPDSVHALPMDLGDLASVRRFADTLTQQLGRLDLLLANAGIMACPEQRVGPGWESQFGINHMGHFALTQALLPLIQSTEDARVVALSSSGHRISDIRWDDLHFEQGYEKWKAYGQAKTANALFANALSRRLRPHGAHAFSVHPGGILTPLQRHLPLEEMMAFGWVDANGELTEQAKQGFKTPTQGCTTTLWAATSPLLEGKPGVFCEDCNISAPVDPDSPYARYIGVMPHATDDDAAERLWALSETLLAEA